MVLGSPGSWFDDQIDPIVLVARQGKSSREGLRSPAFCVMEGPPVIDRTVDPFSKSALETVPLYNLCRLLICFLTLPQLGLHHFFFFLPEGAIHQESTVRVVSLVWGPKLQNYRGLWPTHSQTSIPPIWTFQSSAATTRSLLSFLFGRTI